MERRFMKGCEAIAEAALRAGCRFFAGYPITPQNEIPEYMAKMMPKVGGTFLQGESEVASINMVYGAAAVGCRAMTSSSSPGISLKSEGISYLAGARLPAVIVSVMRAGPGLGTIQPAQTDYFQATKASGHGGFRTIVLAPSTLQEAVDFTYEAFDLACRDRNPVIVAPDGFLGAIMEPVVLPESKDPEEFEKGWAVGIDEERQNVKLILSGSLTEEQQQNFNRECEKMYEKWKKEDVRVEEYLTEDAEYILTAYGTSARICKSAVDTLREKGIKAGLIRPITIFPFPYESYHKLKKEQVKVVIDVEMAIPGQMIEDVNLGIQGRIPVDTVLHSGGIIIPQKEVEEKVMEWAGK